MTEQVHYGLLRSKSEFRTYGDEGEALSSHDVNELESSGYQEESIVELKSSDLSRGLDKI